MLSFIWMCFLTAFTPAGASLATLEAAAFQAHLRAQLEMNAPVPAAIGAAGHISHYGIPALAR